MTQQTLQLEESALQIPRDARQLAFSVQGRQTAVGKKVSKKPVFFRTPCPKCECAEASVSRNQDFVLWFSCPACGYENFWKTVSAKIREYKTAMSKRPEWTEDMNYEAIAEKYF